MILHARLRLGLQALSLPLLLLLSGGCTRYAKLVAEPSDCVNPASGLCPTSGSAGDSRILEVRFYQLKQVVDPCKLDLNAFLDGKDLDLLKSVLTDPQRIDMVRKSEYVEQLKSRPLAPWQLLPGTHYVLAVAFGRLRTKNSVRLLAAEQLTDGMTVHVRGTDLCMMRPCGTSLETECP